MSDAAVVLKDVSVTVHQQNQTKTILDDVDLTIAPGDFVTVLGTNGAGKSTLFNAIAGNLAASGQVTLAGQNVTSLNAIQRAKYIARVFQDPKLGTAGRMTVAENLVLAQHRGERRTLRGRRLEAARPQLQAEAAQFSNGLDQLLDSPTETLSGGQRQSLSLLMAVQKDPALLLLDEHTAALDPHTSAQLMALTDRVIKERHLMALMITHRMDDALKYGNRLIVLENGRLKADYNAAAKAKLKREDLLEFFD
jgi:putative ABC transport system ATP-binding protein